MQSLLLYVLPQLAQHRHMGAQFRKACRVIPCKRYLPCCAAAHSFLHLGHLSQKALHCASSLFVPSAAPSAPSWINDSIYLNLDQPRCDFCDAHVLSQ